MNTATKMYLIIFLYENAHVFIMFSELFLFLILY